MDSNDLNYANYYQFRANNTPKTYSEVASVKKKSGKKNISYS